MYYLNSICFVCFSSEIELCTVIHKETHNEVKYVLPELTILNSEIPLYICSLCHTTLHSFSTFKKKCLDNYSRLNDYIKILEESKDTPDQSSSELQIRVINCEQLINLENDIHLNNKEENEDALISWQQQHDQKTKLDDIIDVKEESLASEDIADRDFYQQFVKRESVPNYEQEALDTDKTNANADTDSELSSDDSNYATTEDTSNSKKITHNTPQHIISSEICSDNITYATSEDTSNLKKITHNTSQHVKIKKTKQDFCIYCKKLITKILRHFETVHKDERQVQEFICLPKRNKERSLLIDKLRKDGNFFFNTNRTLHSEMIITCRRTQKNKQRNADYYIPCPACKGFFSKLTLRRHVRKCCLDEKGVRNILSRTRRIHECIRKETCKILREELIN